MDAKLEWHGSYEADGCGWFLEMNGTYYKPDNEDFIPDTFFQKAPTQVTIEFKNQGAVKYYCGDLPQASKSPGLHLLSIE